MRVVLALAVLLAAGCNQGVQPTAATEANGLDLWSGMPVQPAWQGVDASERAIAYWEMEHGTLNAECAEQVRGAEIKPVDYRTLADVCQSEVVGENAGCMYQRDIHGARIVVDVDQDSPDLRTHELLHVAYDCVNLHSAHNHNDPCWSHVPVAW